MHRNLQRQIIHSTKDIGRKKLDSAEEKLTALNPALNVVKHETMLSSANALGILKDYDIVADGTDNFPTRYLVNDACVLTGKPNVYGSIFRFEGQCSVFATEQGPCYRCLYPEPPPPGLVPSCAEGGVLGILPGLVGVMQATEVIKLILGKGEPLIGRLLLVDALNMRFRELKLRKNPACPVCGENRTIHELIDYQQFCGIVPESKENANMKNGIPQITVQELKQRLDSGEDVQLIDVREPYEFQIAQIGGKLIPQNDVPQRLKRDRSQPRSHRPLPLRRALAAHRRIPEAAGLPARGQRGRWHSGMERAHRPQGSEVLSREPGLRTNDDRLLHSHRRLNSARSASSPSRGGSGGRGGRRPILYGWTFVPHDMDAAASYIDTALKWQQAGSAVPYAILRIADGAVIGSTRFFNIEYWPWPDGHERRGRSAPDVCEVGYTWFASSAIRTRANTEAKYLMLRHAFEQWSVLRVSLQTDLRNLRSQAAIERLGAKKEGVLRAQRLGRTMRRAIPCATPSWPLSGRRCRPGFSDSSIRSTALTGHGGSVH